MQFKGYTLTAFQVHAIEAIRRGDNVLLSAPTGSGKTLVAEYAVEDAVGKGRRAIYTSPIKALSNQKYRDFKADGIEVGLMTGDLSLNPDAPLVIMTTEIFRNAVFEDPRRFDAVDFVIFDEIHFLDDPERGTVWEESLMFAPEHVRFVCLSATISNLIQFGKWIEQTRPHALAVIRHDKRPVPLRHLLFHVDAGVFNLAQRKRAVTNMRRAQTKHRRRGRQGRDERSRRRTPRQAQLQTELLLDDVLGQELLPVLFFCFSRRECEVKARANVGRPPMREDERRRIGRLFDDICGKFELRPDRDQTLVQMRNRATGGVAFHHAGMLPIHKEIVERLFTSGLLKLLFTTETFALGINMPARTVIFDSLRKFDGVSFDYMRTRDYMQMAGRAGRLGIDTEGTVISILDDDDLEDAPLTALFGDKVEPVTSRFNLSYSTIINLYSRMGLGLLDAYDRSFAAFQAASGSQKRQDRARSVARAALRARIEILVEAGYIDDDGLLPRGRMAQRINGYEIQVTELLFDGVLEELDVHQMAATFTALVHEERRSDGTGLASGMGKLRTRIAQAVRRFAAVELAHGCNETLKLPEFGLASAVLAWSSGATLADTTRMAGSDGGDFVRTLRMAIQMMRQLQHALPPGYSLRHRLDEAVVSINRDAVDAKRQFELG
ncbi:MAG: DEAD/DEAH box helicase [Planctomycetota bacterium]